MANTSKPIYVYLQRPDSGQWVTVGRYLFDSGRKVGLFRYAPSYLDGGLPWSIDPVSLPLRANHDWEASRYAGLHDALRDACPDAWGRALLRREHGIPEDAPDWRYLEASSNAERWGALAVGRVPTPSVSHIASPRLPELDALARELIAISQHAPPIDMRLRKKLVATPSIGGARPKATIRDGERYWLVKPYLPSDIANVPLLEHTAQQWGRRAGLRFAESAYHPIGAGLGAVRVLRFDRLGNRRLMALSGASLLQTEYPGQTVAAQWSYPRLAEELLRIGAPAADRFELFGRMVFNAVCGNDDDHPRNHAVVFEPAEERWRLAPAFDVVPNPDPDAPPALAMQVSLGTTRISRASVLADHLRFGFRTGEDAKAHLDQLLASIEGAFREVAHGLPFELQQLLEIRMHRQLRLLRN
jgi:serine/threonine-protein kinase HipA